MDSRTGSFANAAENRLNGMKILDGLVWFGSLLYNFRFMSHLYCSHLVSVGKFSCHT